MGERCHYCSRFRPPSEVMRIGGVIKMCHRCYEHHANAIKAFGGTAQPECYDCQRKLSEMEDEDGKGNVRMHLHVRDGWFYQLLCGPCSAKYVRKRVDLFGDTPYGDKLKLKGTK